MGGQWGARSLPPSSMLGWLDVCARERHPTPILSQIPSPSTFASKAASSQPVRHPSHPQALSISYNDGGSDGSIRPM